MTIPPHGPTDTGWNVDVVIPPKNTLIAIDLLPEDGATLDLAVSAEEDTISLVLGAEGPPGPPGPSEAESVVLQAPNGSRWRLVVSNTGVLSTTPA